MILVPFSVTWRITSPASWQNLTACFSNRQSALDPNSWTTRVLSLGIMGIPSRKLTELNRRCHRKMRLDPVSSHSRYSPPLFTWLWGWLPPVVESSVSNKTKNQKTRVNMRKVALKSWGCKIISVQYLYGTQRPMKAHKENHTSGAKKVKLRRK